MGQLAIGAVVLVVRVYGGHLFDPRLCERSRTRLSAILARAGVNVQWRDCDESAGADPSCGAPPVATEVVVRLLPGPPQLGAHACGAALVPAHGPGYFASVFVDCVAAAAGELRVPRDAVLACTMAHELGHLLLGVNSHGPDGLMQPQPRQVDWDRATRNALIFTTAEVRKLQRELQRRHSEGR